MDGRPTWTDCDEAGDYAVPNVLSPRDLVFRPDNMDETVLHTTIQLRIYVNLKLHKALALFQAPSHGIFSKLVKQTYLFLHKLHFPTLMMTALRTVQLSHRFFSSPEPKAQR